MGELINLNPQSGIPDDIARDTEVAAAIAAHNAADWVHLDYLYRVFVARDRSTQSPSTYVTSAEVASAITSHVAETDPPPIYLTQEEGDGRYLHPTTQRVFRLSLESPSPIGIYPTVISLGSIPGGMAIFVTGGITIGGKIVPPGGLANGQYNYNFAINTSTGLIEIHIKSSDFPNSILPVTILVQQYLQ